MKWQFPFLIIVLALFSGISYADSIYAVNGSLSITGTDVCGGPCVETLNFSFDLGYTPNQYPNEYNLYLIPGSKVSSAGPLGVFALTGLGGSLTNTQWIAFSDAIGDEIDLEILPNQYVSPPGPPSFPSSYLYACRTESCMEEFNPFWIPGTPLTPGNEIGIYNYGTAETTVVAISEGPELAILGIGFLGMLGAAIRRNGFSPAAVVNLPFNFDPMPTSGWCAELSSERKMPEKCTN